MSVIHITQIKNVVLDLFQHELDIKDIGVKDAEREIKILSRCLAAYAIYSTTECTAQEAAQSVVDGGDDNGIDAIFHSSLQKMYIVQSKWSKDGNGEPDKKGISNFCNGVKDLVDLKFDRFNEKIYKKHLEIKKAIEEYGWRIELIFIDTHLKADLAKHSQRLIDDLLNEINDTSDLIKFSRMNQLKVHASLASSSGNAPINLEIGLSNWGKIEEPYKAYYGLCSGREVAEWWLNYDLRLFDKNIRQVMGSTDVNEEIEKTINDHTDRFWYFNNGITIISDEIKKSFLGGGSTAIGSFNLSNVAIVNGAQTVSTIGKFMAKSNSNQLEDLKVSVRMIELKGALAHNYIDFGKDITKANNRQNRIENRDFATQDPEQSRIQKELLIDKIEYNISRSENNTPTDKSFGLIEATVALACASGKTSLVVQAKGGIGKFFENLEGGIYKELFNSSTSGYYVFNAVKVIRYIENYLKKRVESIGKSIGREYGLLVHGNRIIALMTISQLGLKKNLDSYDFEIDENKLNPTIDSIVINLLNYLDTHHKENVLGSLFKNSKKCSAMVDSLNKDE